MAISNICLKRVLLGYNDSHVTTKLVVLEVILIKCDIADKICGCDGLNSQSSVIRLYDLVVLAME